MTTLGGFACTCFFTVFTTGALGGFSAATFTGALSVAVTVVAPAVPFATATLTKLAFTLVSVHVYVTAAPAARFPIVRLQRRRARVGDRDVRQVDVAVVLDRDREDRGSALGDRLRLRVLRDRDRRMIDDDDRRSNGSVTDTRAESLALTSGPVAGVAVTVATFSKFAVMFVLVQV